MKKNLIFILLLGISMMSCNNDYDEVSYDDLQNKQVNNQKVFNEFENFRLAINEMNRPEYAPTEEYLKRYGDELSDERKQILLEPAKELIFSTGIPERELTNNDVNQILNKAFKIYVSKTSKK